MRTKTGKVIDKGYRNSYDTDSVLDSKKSRLLPSDFCINLPKAGLRVKITFHCMQQSCHYYTFTKNVVLS